VIQPTGASAFGSAGAFVHRYAKLASWDAAGRPVFVILAVFFLHRSLRRRYLSWKESSGLRLMAAAVTVQATVRAMAARRELSVRKQTRAATRIQVLAYSDQL
jgi:myosin-5